jgi:hypothetical protein
VKNQVKLFSQEECAFGAGWRFHEAKARFCQPLRIGCLGIGDYITLAGKAVTVNLSLAAHSQIIPCSFVAFAAGLLLLYKLFSPEASL